MYLSQPPPPLPSSNAISTPPGDPQDQRPGARLVKREAVTAASGGSVRVTRTISHAEPATGHLTRWWCGGVGRSGRRAGASLRSGAVGAGARRGTGVEQTVQIVNLDKDPMERRTVRSDGADARWEPRFGAERSARVPGGGLGSSRRCKS